jgi:hypothetical protein
MKTKLTEKITTATFQALNYFSEYLYSKQNKLPYHAVQKKVSAYLVENGDKNFINLYNNCVETDNFTKVLSELKIY